MFIIKRFNRILSLLLTLFILASFFSVNTLADKAVKNPIINVSSTSAVPDDTIVVDVSIDKNPGIMAMTFTLCYDNKAFEYKGYKKGILSDYLVVDHPERGYISFVNCEKEDTDINGTVFAAEFIVKGDAQAGKYDMQVKHIRPDTHGSSMSGCFADWQGNKISPTVNNGSVTIGFTGKNCKHKFGGWQVTVPPLCEDTGVNTRICNICGHSELFETPAIYHSYEAFWTVDRIATESESGLLTRHCERCTAATDKVTFSIKDAKTAGFDNKIGIHVASTSWEKLEEIEKENNEKQEQDSNQEQPDPDVDNEPEAIEPDSNETDEDGNPNTSENNENIMLPENADQLIISSKQPMGLGARLYRLFMGTQSSDGIFKMIKEQLPEDLSRIIEYKYIIISVLVFSLVI